MVICNNFIKWIQETRSKTTRRWVEDIKRVCKKLPWPLSLLCKVVTKLIEIVEIVFFAIFISLITVLCYYYQALLVFAETLFILVVGLWVRSLGLIDFFGGLAGILPIKNLRVHIVILTRPDGSRTVPPGRIGLAVKRASEIFRQRARIKLIHTVHVVKDPAPRYALHVKADEGLFLDHANDAGAYFRYLFETHLTPLLPAFALRFGAPVVVFVVDGVGGADSSGCSTGPFADYICIEGGTLIVPPQLEPVTTDLEPEESDLPAESAWPTLAHELAHSCGLAHDFFDTSNLMFEKLFVNGGLLRGTNLSPLQRGIVRNSTHVTYF